MIQVQTFLKNHLNKFNIGRGSGQTIFSYGRYYKSYNYRNFHHAQTLSKQQSYVDSYSYKGENGAILDK